MERKAELMQNDPGQPEIPTVSVIIVTYQAAAALQACLNSIYRQEYPHIEIVVMDGASTDGTVEILRQNSDRITLWRSEPDLGIYDAMNKAIGIATGDWLCFIGADDELLPGFSDMARELKDPSAIYYGSVLYKGEKRSGFIKPYKMVKMGMHHQSMFYAAAIFKKHRYNLDYRISADSVLNMECWKDKQINFIFKDHIIANFNHTGISSAHYDPLLKKNMSGLIWKNFGCWLWLRYQFRNLKAMIR